VSEAGAWLLGLGNGLHAAIGQMELVHLLPDPPTLFEIPQSPAYCRQVLVWQGEVVPLMDLSMRLQGLTVSATRPLVAITAYTDVVGSAPSHGALLLDGPPARIRVSDADACALPAPEDRWRRLAVACFNHSTRGPVPVLDLGRIYAPPVAGQG